MAAKVVWYRNAWWVRTHHRRRKKDRRIGPTKADKQQADEIARKLNAAIALGQLDLDTQQPEPIRFDAYVRDWHRRYSPTFKPSHEVNTRALVENHLVPFFGRKEIGEIRDADLLDYVRAKLEAGQAPATILNGLSVVRRVLNLAHRDGLVPRNPALRLGELMRRVDRRTASEVTVADAWSREEAGQLLRLARRHEPRFFPLLLFLLSTGARRGEALGLKWADVDFDRARIAIRRAWVRNQLTTPKSGRGRNVAMPPALAEVLFDLLAERRREALTRAWRETPEWVFCSARGTPIDERNIERTWYRVRRRAQKAGVRPLKLHAARHTYASLALASGKSVRWVAEQLGHANPELTLRTYAHVLREEESDLSFVDFGVVRGVSRRLYTSPTDASTPEDENAPDASRRERSRFLERETGLEPATLSLGR